MSILVQDYVVISLINAALMLSGAGIAITARHALSQWRLNKPVQATQKP